MTPSRREGKHACRQQRAHTSTMRVAPQSSHSQVILHTIHAHNLTNRPSPRPAHLADCGPHPGAVVVEAFDAVVVDGAVVRARRLVEVAGVIVAHRHTVAIDIQVLAPVVTHAAVKGATHSTEGCKKRRGV